MDNRGVEPGGLAKELKGRPGGPEKVMTMKSNLKSKNNINRKSQVGPNFEFWSFVLAIAVLILLGLAMDSKKGWAASELSTAKVRVLPTIRKSLEKDFAKFQGEMSGNLQHGKIVIQPVKQLPTNRTLARDAEATAQNLK